VGKAAATTRTDYRHIAVYACCCLAILIVIEAMRLAPSPYAPRVSVRWAPDVTPVQRAEIEREFGLIAGTQREDMTWAYDLADRRPERVKALIANPAVADTHYIDRSTGAVSADAPQGTTLIDVNPLTFWRDSLVVEWIVLFTECSLLVSALWMVVNRRPKS
jgi:hypothetical protein